MRKQDRPLTPSGPDLALFLQEEREQTKRENEKLLDAENRSDLHESQRALDAGRTEFDFRGKRIRGRGGDPSSSATHPSNNERKISDHFANSALIAMSWAVFFKSVQGDTQAAGALLAAASGNEFTPRYADQTYVYDEIKVSRATRERLDAQLEEISRFTAEMEKLDIEADPFAPWKENELWDQRKCKLDEYGMRPLPDKSGYAHNCERVVEMEYVVNPYSIAQHVPVMVYLPRSQLPDGMRIYSKVGDPNNTDPAEAIASGDQLKVQVQARPIPPPNFTYDG